MVETRDDDDGVKREEREQRASWTCTITVNLDAGSGQIKTHPHTLHFISHAVALQDCIQRCIRLLGPKSHEQPAQGPDGGGERGQRASGPILQRALRGGQTSL